MVFGNKETREQARQDKEREQAEARTRQAEAQARETDRLAKANVAREREIEQFISNFKVNLQGTVQAGTPVSLFKDVYIPVDAQMNQFGPPSGLDLEPINALGAQGWTVQGLIPRTYGGFESYKISKTTAYGVSGFGKDELKVGLGGHVVGVYALMTFTVTQLNLDTSGPLIDEAAKKLIPASLRQPVK